MPSPGFLVRLGRSCRRMRLSSSPWQEAQEKSCVCHTHPTGQAPLPATSRNVRHTLQPLRAARDAAATALARSSRNGFAGVRSTGAAARRQPPENFRGPAPPCLQTPPAAAPGGAPAGLAPAHQGAEGAASERRRASADSEPKPVSNPATSSKKTIAVNPLPQSAGLLKTYQLVDQTETRACNRGSATSALAQVIPAKSSSG